MTHRFKSLVTGASLALCVALGAGSAAAGTVFVNHDEWTLSNTGFTNAPTTGQFVSNLVAEFGPVIHAYSSNFGFTESSLSGAMSSAGATYTTGTGITFDLPTISTYDAIFLGGFALYAGELADLATYVAGGGNVYIAGGTAAISGGSSGEAAAWNGFLAPFGVQMNTVYNGISGTAAVSGDPLFTGVAGLYQNNGNGLSGGSVVCCGQDGLYAVSRVETPAIPLPPTVLMLGAVVAALGWRGYRASTR